MQAGAESTADAATETDSSGDPITLVLDVFNLWKGRLPIYTGVIVSESTTYFR